MRRPSLRFSRFGLTRMRSGIFILGGLVLVAGCGSPIIHSFDPQANYRHVFSNVRAPEPLIVHSHVEREQRGLPGLFALRSRYNGDWEFELLASPAWVEEVKAAFSEIQFADVWPRKLPNWFLPDSDQFTAWKMQPTSYPAAHLFIEKKPISQDRIRVFIRRH